MKTCMGRRSCEISRVDPTLARSLCADSQTACSEHQICHLCGRGVQPKPSSWSSLNDSTVQGHSSGIAADADGDGADRVDCAGRASGSWHKSTCYVCQVCHDAMPLHGFAKAAGQLCFCLLSCIRQRSAHGKKPEARLQQQVLLNACCTTDLH
jgi:hypothetical protein